MKLISMTDFVLERSTKSIKEMTVLETFKDGAKITNEIFNYAKFLKQPLSLWMFVPCELVGEEFANWQPIRQPRKYKDSFEHFLKFEKSREDCLFKGFSNPDIKEKMFVLSYKNQGYWIPKDDTIEGLMFNFIPYEIELTGTALKQIYSNEAER